MSRSDTRIVIEDRVSRSDTRIVYGSGVTFRHQDSIWIGCHVPTPGYNEDRSVTFRHQDSILRSGVSRTDTRGIKIMNLER